MCVHIIFVHNQHRTVLSLETNIGSDAVCWKRREYNIKHEIEMTTAETVAVVSTSNCLLHRDQ